MSPTKELKVAYALAIGLLVAGVLCYAGHPSKTQDQPIRKVFTGVGGAVLFDHKTHAGEYGLACNACHHHPEEPEKNAPVLSCGACHSLPKDGSLPANCLTCHPKDPVTLDGVKPKTEAFHAQCIGCHKESSGPVECASCHGL